MTTMNPKASIEEKMDHIMSHLRVDGFTERVSRYDLTKVIMREWGASRETVKMAIDALVMFTRVKAISPKVFLIIGSWKDEADEVIENSEDETAAEDIFTAKTIEEDFKRMLRVYQDRHPAGMKGGPSEDQDMTWILTTKGKYGLH